MENQTCPSCDGSKIISGECECSSEWRTLDDDNVLNDCVCGPDTACLTCEGTGYIATKSRES
jgi:hypothetical protein